LISLDYKFQVSKS